MGGFYRTSPPATPNSSLGSYCAPAVSHHVPSSASSEADSFHYNPYDTECSKVLCHTAASYQATLPAPVVLPYGTLHTCLEGRVSFVPYPTEEFVLPPAAVPKESMVRVFIGQLPYQVTDMQLNWLCYTFGNGFRVHYPERITKHDTLRGCKVPTGCIHAYCTSETAAEMLNSMHKRILVDDTGVWFAETQEQQAVLNDYCQMMKVDRTLRFQNRPYDTVVAQFATSSYVPPRRR